MASKQVWENWHSSSRNKGSDEDILSMMSDLVTTISSLEKIYGSKTASLIVRSLLLDWTSLKNIADARGIRNYERPQ